MDRAEYWRRRYEDITPTRFEPAGKKGWRLGWERPRAEQERAPLSGPGRPHHWERLEEEGGFGWAPIAAIAGGAILLLYLASRAKKGAESRVGQDFGDDLGAYGYRALPWRGAPRRRYYAPERRYFPTQQYYAPPSYAPQYAPQYAPSYPSYAPSYPGGAPSYVPEQTYAPPATTYTPPTYTPPVTYTPTAPAAQQAVQAGADQRVLLAQQLLNALDLGAIRDAFARAGRAWQFPADIKLPLALDGILGPDTSRVLAAVQQQLGLQSTGQPDDRTIQLLQNKIAQLAA
jgi:hypothetical protein